MRATVEDMLSGKPDGFRPTFEQGVQLRSFFREMGEADGLPNSEQGIWRQMSKAVDSAMEKTANNVGSAKEWRDANQGWKDYATKYGDKQSPLVRILKQSDPAKITRDLMNRGSAADVETLQNEGMTAALEPLRRQVIQDIARNKFTVGRDGLGGYSDSFIKSLFGPDGAKEIYLKADLSRRLNWDPNPSRTSNVMVGMEQLKDPSLMAKLAGAARLSMPRDATSFLPKVARTNPFPVSPSLMGAASSALRPSNE
jgi:hypothetical protein